MSLMLLQRLKHSSIVRLGSLSRFASTMTNIKAVVFDMGGVLIPSPGKAFLNFEQQTGLPSGSLLQTIVKGGLNGSPSKAWEKLETGAITVEEFPALFGEELHKLFGVNVDFAQLLASMDLAEVDHEMIKLVAECREKGFKTAVLTNNWKNKQGTSLLPIDTSYFDIIVESCKVGYRKPDLRIYELLLQQLGCLGNQVVFLDDIGQNLKAAQKFGIQTIKVTSTQQASDDLHQLLATKSLPKGTRQVPEKLKLDENVLKSCLASMLGHKCDDLVVRCFSHGQSNPTYYLRTGDHQLVLRKKPPGKLLPSAHAIDREYKVMKALRVQGLPIPHLLTYCHDSTILGTEFYLMDYMEGKIFKDIRLDNVKADKRRSIYMSMIEQLAQLHKVDIDKAGLGDFGKRTGYLQRNLDRWTKQYESSKTHPIPEMDFLYNWLKDRLPSDKLCTIVHGDYRLDNLVFDLANYDKVIGILDWELSTLGHPYTDLATSMLFYYLPEELGKKFFAPSLMPLPEGIPTHHELLAKYCSLMGIASIPNFDYFVVFCVYRFAAILQGVYKRALQGQGSAANAEMVGETARDMAKLGQSIAERSGLLSTNSSVEGESHASSAGPLALSIDDMRSEVRDIHRKVRDFVQTKIIPLEKVFNTYYEEERSWIPHPKVEELKSEAKRQGLWNLFLPVESDPQRKFSPGLTNLEYALICEEMGHSVYAPEIFNCNAPDTGNMEVLVRYGTQAQKDEWLGPLLEGTIRSCFAMTEPAVASSDATNIQASITKTPDGKFYVLNGHKWWTSNAMHPNCKLAIFMGKTRNDGAIHTQQSMILVPMDSPGVKIVRPLHVFGFVDRPAGHAEVLFENVRVPVENLLLGEGRGFEIAQGRLGPGRVHHCMRLIGHCERALALTCQRAVSRTAFGKPLAAQGSLQQEIGWNRAQVEACRSLILKTAHIMDKLGNKAAKQEIALIKVLTPRITQQVIDSAIQVHGGAGVSLDFPLSVLFTWARVLRLADGPDEVHLAQIAKQEIRKHNIHKL